MYAPVKTRIWLSLIGLVGVDPVFDMDGAYTPNSANAYKLDAADKAAYPRFAKLVDQLPQFLAAHKTVLTTIMYYTGLSSDQVLAMVVPGKGPKIIIKEGMDSEWFGHYERYDGAGDPLNPKPNEFWVNANWVRGLESANLKSTQQATAFFLAITIFHESVHLGRNMEDHDDHYEYGNKFEEEVFKVKVTPGNVTGRVDYTFILK